MDPLAIVYLGVNVAVVAYMRRRVGPHVSASLLLFAVLLLLYGPAHVLFHAEGETGTALFRTITWGLLLMWAGLIVGRELAQALQPQCWSIGPQAARRWDSAPLAVAYRSGTVFRAAALLLLSVLAIDLVAEAHLPKIAAYYAGGGLLEDQILFRRQEGGSAFYLVNLLTLTVAPFISFVLLCEAHRIGRLPARLAFCAAALIVLLAKLATLQKSPAAIYVLQLFFAWWLIRSNRPSLGKLLAALVMFVVLMLPVTMVAFPELEPEAILGYFYDRVFEVPQEVLVNYFTVYPDEIDFLMGQGVRLVAALFGDREYTASALVVAALRDSEGASFNGLFIADAWADFGYVGIAVSSTALGAIARLVDAYCYAQPKSGLSIAVLASMPFAVVYVSSASFLAALLTGGMVLVPLLSALLRTRWIGTRRRAASTSATVA